MLLMSLPAMIASADMLISSSITILIGRPAAAMAMAVWVAILAPSIWPLASAALMSLSSVKLTSSTFSRPFLAKMPSAAAICHWP